MYEVCRRFFFSVGALWLLLPQAPDGSKVKLKEYLLADEMTSLLRAHCAPVAAAGGSATGAAVPTPLRLDLAKAGHDRCYSAVPVAK